MPEQPLPPPQHVRGLARLATDATTEVTDLVEAIHARILSVPGLPASTERTQGITGLVYKTVRGITQLTAHSLDAVLGVLEPALMPRGSWPEREALLAALNGVLGDHLARTGNPLAIPMALRYHGQALDLGDLSPLPCSKGRLLVLIHGLCMNELQWTRQGHDHGQTLGAELGFDPIYLRYNSGLHISHNGRALAQMLEHLVRQSPDATQRMVLLTHSMGGLVARSALYYGQQAGHAWPQRVSDLFFLGTPHHGAPLERAGQGVERLLNVLPYAAPLARLGRLRSAGITDLRHGNLLDEDWTGRDRFARHGDRRQHVPLPTAPRCYTIASTLGRDRGDLKDRLLGDGLVPLDSALGLHHNPALQLHFETGRQWTGCGIGHLDMLNDAGVFAQLKAWLQACA